MKLAVVKYTPGAHYSWGEVHDGARATRVLSDDSEQQRLECSCGKTSRWTYLSDDTSRAAERHLNDVTPRRH